MKRSEMVEIIQNELAGHLNYQTMPIIVASELLAKLEEKGMLPPDFYFELEGHSSTRVHEWEQEEE